MQDGVWLHRCVSARQLRFFIEVPVLLFVRFLFSFLRLFYFFSFVTLSTQTASRQLSRWKMVKKE